VWTPVTITDGGRLVMQVSLDEALTVREEKGQDLIALDDALTALAVIDARKSEVVELRFLAG
jgi:hypothetical protein